MSYKYNGVVLPDINSVWVDKETYPFAFILYYEPADIYEIDLITTKDLKYYRLNSANWYLHSNVYFSYIVYELSDGLWADGGSSNSYLYGEEFRDHFGNDDWKIIWTSESLYDRYSGQLVLEASDPEPVNSQTAMKFPLRDWITGIILERCSRAFEPRTPIGYLYGHIAREGETIQDGAKEYIINGNRYFGIVAPDIDTQWTDELKVTHPHAVMWYNKTKAAPRFGISYNKPSYIGSYVYLTRVKFADLIDGVWQFGNQIYGTVQADPDSIFWTSDDIYDVNVIYLTSSTPIPIYE